MNHNGQTPVKLAPHSVEAEEAVLGAILMDEERFNTVAAFLTTDSFFVLRNAYVWEAMTRLKNRGDVIDNLTVIDELRQQERLPDVGGGAYITYLINNTPTSLHAEVYGRVVQRAYTRRCILEIASQMASEATDSDLEAYEVVNNAVHAVNDLATSNRRRTEDTGANLGDITARVIANFIDPESKPDRLSTGIPGLDRSLGGGYERGHHQVIGASKRGKTILLLNMAYEFARQGKHVLYVIMESNQDFVGRRLLARHMKINPEYLKRGEVPAMRHCSRCSNQPFDVQLQCSCRQGPGYEQAFFKRLKEAQDFIDHELSLRVVDRVVHLNTWRQTIEAAERDWERTADVIIMDYGQNVALPSGMGEIEGHIRFGNGLTEYGMNNKRWMFTALQVKKEGDAGIIRPPTSNDVRGTSYWFNCADTQITIFRDPVKGAAGEVVGCSNKGIITLPAVRDSEFARPVPVTLVPDGLFFAEAHRE